MIDAFDLKGDFRSRLEPVLADWLSHLLRNVSTAQAVLRKILPRKLTATPDADGGWTISGPHDLSNVLKEAGYSAVVRALQTAGVIDEETRENSGSKLMRTRCPSPCSGRPSVTCTTRPRRTPRR